MVLKKLSILLLYLAISQTVFAVYFNHIGMNDGLSQVSVMSIYQDPLGRMWFGTREGISVYDGERMRIFKDWGKENREEHINVLLGHECDFIVGNRNGDVFFRTSGSMVRYDIRKETFHVVSNSVNTITSVDGEIWAANGNRIYKYDETGDSLYLYLEAGFQGITCLQVAENKIWAGTSEGLYAIDEQGKTHCFLDKTEIYSLFKSSSKEIWVGSRAKGLYRITPDEKMIHYSEGSPGRHRLANNQIRGFAEDRYGNIWFGTFMGLQKYNPYTDQFTVYQPDYLPGSLSHSSVFSLCIDRQETIWVGTYYGGVNYFNEDKEIFSIT